MVFNVRRCFNDRSTDRLVIASLHVYSSTHHCLPRLSTALALGEIKTLRTSEQWVVQFKWWFGAWRWNGMGTRG